MPCVSSDCGLGLRGIGGGVSPPLLLGLVGGLLKGDVTGIDRTCSLWPFWGVPEEEGFGGITGFSARLMGGGTGLGGSRLNSPDRRGGGGDGGLDRGATFGSVGEWLRLVTLNVRGEVLVGGTTASGLRKVERSPWSRDCLPLGGECGGCTVTDGGFAGPETLGGTGRVADRIGEWARGSSRVGSLRAETEGLGLVAGGTRGGAGLCSGFPFCVASGLAGETDRGGGGCGGLSLAVFVFSIRGGCGGCGDSSLVLPIFSKWDSSDETGL